jgi:hypothetical protein
MNPRRSRGLVAAVVGAFALAAVPAASAASTSTAPPPGCYPLNANQWGTNVCQDPAHPLLPKRWCPNFTDRNTDNGRTMIRDEGGYYYGAAKVWSSVPCWQARRLVDEAMEGGSGYVGQRPYAKRCGGPATETAAIGRASSATATQC